MDFISELTNEIGSDCIILNEIMSAHTTFKVGGPAKYFVSPKTYEHIEKSVTLAKKWKISYTVVGNGSNLLVSDEGYDGIIIHIGNSLSNIEVKDNLIYAQAGASLAAIFNAAKANSLAGFEFASGIPGNLGGACYMNAGAYGGEMKDVLKQVTTLTPEGTIKEYTSEEMELGYRSSAFERVGDIVLSAVIELSPGDRMAITELAADFNKRRTDKQPLNYPSAGSTFKRPEGYFAGKLIEDAGLKGKGIGNACVSEKHAGFVINKGNATARDVYDTINFVKEEVKKATGVLLETEVKFIGNF